MSSGLAIVGACVVDEIDCTYPSAARRTTSPTRRRARNPCRGTLALRTKGFIVVEAVGKLNEDFDVAGFEHEVFINEKVRHVFMNLLCWRVIHSDAP